MAQSSCIPSDHTLIEQLSPRRRAVLELIAKGLTNDEIGNVLQISPATVRTHITGLLAALQVTNRTEAAALYLAVAASPARVEQVMARPAIAVLPLQALGNDSRSQTVASGLTHDLLALFARSTWFPVIANVSSAGARALGGTTPEIGRSMGARFIVDGTLQVFDESWRLSVRLDDANDGRCLWTERYEFSSGELFKVQDAVCSSIVAASYSVMVTHVLSSTPRAHPVEDLGAWELAHQGMALRGLREPEANAQARSLFKAAIEREAGLALAHFGLGLCHYDEALNQWGERERACDGLLACAQRCLELAPHAGEGYFLLARHRQARGEHTCGQQPLEAAIGRNPSFAAAHALLGQILLMAGRIDEGVARMKHASRLGPGAFVAGLAVAHFLRGENAEALEAAERALASNPRYTFARAVAAASAFWQGDYKRAALHTAELRHAQRDFDASRFLQTFGAGFDGVSRIFQALRALGAAG